jgi:hypothetical protein
MRTAGRLALSAAAVAVLATNRPARRLDENTEWIMGGAG